MIALALLVAIPLTCGAVPRPGVATLGQDGIWRGAAVEACRRAATRIGRPGSRFRAYRTPAALRASAQDDIAFLSTAEQTSSGASRPIAATGIASSTQVLVGRTTVVPRGRPILCFIIGSAAEDALAAWLDATHHDMIPLGFQEPDEMSDGLASGKCQAMAIDLADRMARDTVMATLSILRIDAVTAPQARQRLAAALR